MDEIKFESPATTGLVSIVIPTFNKDRFIGETLDSISRQQYTNWEVLVVEDSSRGETEAIVKQFASQHPKHRVDYSRNERNCGVSDTRNVGFTKSRGEYVALLDADDRWLPDHLTVAVRALEETGKDLVYSTVLMIEDQTEMPLAVWGPDGHDLANFPYGLFRRNYITPSATVMRREVLGDIGPWIGFLYCEDAEYWFRCIAGGKQFHHVGGCHCLYRKNHEGATTQRLCTTLEVFAEISARYARSIPGLKRSHSTKGAAQAYINAAQCHATSSPQRDASADPARAAALAFEAWKLRRKHIDYLWRLVRYSARNLARTGGRKMHIWSSRLMQLAGRSGAANTARVRPMNSNLGKLKS